jgi:signal transduction histidine kinase
VRVRLTVLYGGLFLVSGVVLLAITYVLVDRATADETVTVAFPDGSSVTARTELDEGLALDDDVRSSGVGSAQAPVMPDPQQLRAIAAEQHAGRMQTLVTQSGIALAVMAALAVVLGWLVAGRVLRPLRTITATTRRITANDLHERLALGGPDDELKELGDTVDELLARLERTFNAQRQFVANASHELRTPLARQRALAQVALDDPDATVETLRHAHERVLAAGAEQAHLIDALLVLARGQAGRERDERVDLAALAHQAIDGWGGEAEARGLLVVAELDAAPVRGDRSLLERLVGNLIDNAIRYNHSGGTVQVVTAVRDGRPTLTVVNTGPQVPRESVPEIIQPFHRLDSGRTHQDGHGLGLSIVSAVADLHHAALAIAPPPSGGLHVTVSWPG